MATKLDLTLLTHKKTKTSSRGIRASELVHEIQKSKMFGLREGVNVDYIIDKYNSGINLSEEDLDILISTICLQNSPFYVTELGEVEIDKEAGTIGGLGEF